MQLFMFVMFALVLIFPLPAWANQCDLDAHSQLIIHQQLNRVPPGSDELSQWKQWESLLLACRKAVDTTKPESLQNFLFLGYVGKQSNSAATKEYITGELYPLFSEAPDKFLSVLKRNPSFINATCYYLGRHFGFEGKQPMSKAAFLKAQANRFFQQLPEQQAQQCLAAFIGG